MVFQKITPLQLLNLWNAPTIKCTKCLCEESHKNARCNWRCANFYVWHYENISKNTRIVKILGLLHDDILHIFRFGEISFIKMTLHPQNIKMTLHPSNLHDGLSTPLKFFWILVNIFHISYSGRQLRVQYVNLMIIC